MTPDERHIMEHSLGWPRNYRNHYVTAPDCAGWNVLQELCGRGLMQMVRGPEPMLGQMSTFVVTDEGKRIVEVWGER